MNSPLIHYRRFCFVVLFFCIYSGFVLCDDFGIPRRNSRPAFSVSPSPVPPAPIPAPAAPKQASPYKEPEQSVQTESSPPFSVLNSPLPNVVRVVAFDKHGQSLGSGSYIGNYGEYGLILSNWHVTDKTEGLVHIHFPNGFSSYGAVIQADTLWDLTLIVISHPPQSVPRLPVSSSEPKPGDALRIAGYGAGSYRIAGGRCVRYLAPETPKKD
ncbi:MAG: trypsin-like peptidase domain-containing protein, partial [Planctomycetaceae bacterium]|nr:trypsin-like peptidase domain-containing protein [Planctomycetaceae bacterium]